MVVDRGVVVGSQRVRGYSKISETASGDQMSVGAIRGKRGDVPHQ